MKMDKTVYEIIDKFISGERLTETELFQLDRLLNKSTNKTELIQYLEKRWNSSTDVQVDIPFEIIWEKVNHNSNHSMKKQMWRMFTRIASIFFIPLLATSIYLSVNHPFSDQLLTLSTQKGEFTSVILPDGSKVWLNVNSELSYPVNFGLTSRNMELKGEAYFEVEKNKKMPFKITAGNLTTKVLGTRFAISVYPESSEMKTSLLEGSVEVEYLNNSVMLEPGQQIIISQNESGFRVDSFNEEYELGWINNQLVFQLTPFDQVVNVLEMWYDISIDYDPVLFKTDVLTVRFGQHETLENVLLVLSRATGSNYSVTNEEIKITKNN